MLKNLSKVNKNYSKTMSEKMSSKSKCILKTESVKDDIVEFTYELSNKENREATFYCALTFVYNNEFIQVEGYKNGHIATKIGRLGGFTFGPVFVPEGYNKPYNELSNFETHRHNAIAKLIKKLKEHNII